MAKATTLRSRRPDRPGRAAVDPARAVRAGGRRDAPAGGDQARLLHGPRPPVPPAAAVRRPARDAPPRRPRLGDGRHGRVGPGDASATSGSSRASAAGPSGRSPGSRTTPGSIDATWFGRRFIERRLAVGAEIVVSGKVKHFGRQLTLDNPEFQVVADDTELLHAGRIVPVYPLTAGLTSIRLRAAIREALDKAGYAYPEYLPADDRRRGGAGADRAGDRGGPLPGHVRGSRRGAPPARLRRAAGPPARDGPARAASGSATRRPRSRSTPAADAAVRATLADAIGVARRPARSS